MPEVRLGLVLRMHGCEAHPCGGVQLAAVRAHEAPCFEAQTAEAGKEETSSRDVPRLPPPGGLGTQGAVQLIGEA